MKKINKKYTILEAAVIIAIALAFIMPGAAVVINNTSEQKIPMFNSKNAQPIELETATPLFLSNEYGRLDDILIFPGEGDDILPDITKDDTGHTIITWTNEPDITSAHMSIWFSDEPSVPEAWLGWGISLQGTELTYYWDTAFVRSVDENGYHGLYGVWIAEDLGAEVSGFYLIPNIEDDASLWEFYSWTGEVPDISFAGIDDQACYHLDLPDNNYNAWGPFNGYIYHEIFEPDYDIPDCPINFHNGGEGGISYFDGQSHLLTAPASDMDYAHVGENDRMHIVWQYHNATRDVDQIVWKKIVVVEEPDIEYTPYQAYIGDGTHPAVAAYDDVVAVIYEAGENITVAFSDDQGDSFDSVVLAQGVLPDIEAIGNLLYATYIKDGNLLLTTSGDGGATWSPETQLNDLDGCVEEIENGVDIHVGGVVWVDNRGDDLDIAWTKLPSEAPAIVDTNFPVEVKIDEETEFFATAVDDQGDDYYLMFDWGDNSTPEWTTESFASGEEGSDSHTWTAEGTFEIRVKAKDSAGHEGEWSPPIPIEVPRNKGLFESWFLDILERFFPNLYEIIMCFVG